MDIVGLMVGILLIEMIDIAGVGVILLINDEIRTDEVEVVGLEVGILLVEMINVVVKLGVGIMLLLIRTDKVVGVVVGWEV